MPHSPSFETRVFAGKLYGIPSTDVNDYQIRQALKAAALYRSGKTVKEIVKELGIKPVNVSPPARALRRDVERD